MITASAVPDRPLNVRSRRLDGSLCIANDREALRLSPVAEAVWRLIDGNATVAELSEAVAARFGVELEVVSPDVIGLLEQLAERDLVDVR